MRAECWERNQRCRKRDWPRWYLIRDTEAGWAMETVEGGNAEEVWALLDDKPLVPVGWPAEKVYKDVGLARWRLQHGMPADVFMLWSAPGREERRRAWIASRLPEQIENSRSQTGELETA